MRRALAHLQGHPGYEDSQAGAVQAAPSQACRERIELVVEGRDGRLQRRDSYGNDPARARG